MNSQEIVTVSFQRYVCIFIFSLLFVLSRADAQLPFPQSRPSMTSASPVLPSSATSDSVATQALHSVIQASGGMKAWRETRSAKIRLTITALGSTQSHESLMLDDWSSDSPRYRRGTVGSNRTPKEHSGQATFIASQGEQKRAVPEFDQARVLAGSLPAAAAEIILRNPAYIAVQASGARCTSDSLCVDIYRQTASKSPLIREEEWIISQSTGLPTVIDIILPNLAGVRPIFEEFKFDQWTNEHGVQIPSKIEMRHPSGATQVRTVVSFQPSAGFDTASFDKELSR